MLLALNRMNILFGLAQLQVCLRFGWGKKKRKKKKVDFYHRSQNKKRIFDVKNSPLGQIVTFTSHAITVGLHLRVSLVLSYQPDTE